MKYKTLDDFNFKGKRVIVRSDLNSEISDGKVVLNDRIIESARTISELKRKGARVIVLAHQGRSGGSDFISLRKHARLLSRYVKIKFVDDTIGRKALEQIDKLKNGQALLLENVRFLKEEFEGGVSNKMVAVLGKLGDYYVNDAFSVCHRAQTSVVSLPRVLKSCVGRTMEKELNALEKIKIRDCLFILGGAKAEDDLLLMGKRNILTCGIFGQLCLIAKGNNFGAQNKFLKKELRVLPKLKRVVEGILTPMDLAVKAGGRRKELRIDEFPSRYGIYDIGERTQKMYADLIKNSGGVFMKGTAGYCEDGKFCKGTFALLRAIASSRAFSVLSGGHLNSALKKSGINKKKFGYVSLSGGAAVWYLAGKKLPGIEALKRGRK